MGRNVSRTAVGAQKGRNPRQKGRIVTRTAQQPLPSLFTEQHDWVLLTVCLFFLGNVFWILAKILCLCNTMLCGMAEGGQHADPPAWCGRKGIPANQWPKTQTATVLAAITPRLGLEKEAAGGRPPRVQLCPADGEAATGRLSAGSQLPLLFLWVLEERAGDAYGRAAGGRGRAVPTGGSLGLCFESVLCT